VTQSRMAARMQRSPCPRDERGIARSVTKSQPVTAREFYAGLQTSWSLYSEEYGPKPSLSIMLAA
jgi:hypothetical protein